MKANCSQCHGTIAYSEAGGLFEMRCTSCDWKREGSVSYRWPEIALSERMPVMVAKAASPVTAAVLKCMREVFVEAQRLPLNELAAQLSSDNGLLVGTLQAYRMADVTARLSSTGVHLLRAPHEEEDH